MAEKKNKKSPSSPVVREPSSKPIKKGEVSKPITRGSDKYGKGHTLHPTSKPPKKTE